MRAIIAALMVLAAAGGCDDDVAVDCAERREQACPDEHCGWTTEGCRNLCETDDDCADGTACAPATFVPVEGTLEEWSSFSGLACAPE